jgi:hypothetical protein
VVQVEIVLCLILLLPVFVQLNIYLKMWSLRTTQNGITGHCKVLELNKSTDAGYSIVKISCKALKWHPYK